ncbi:NUDIX hydrolase [Falsibacillus pallidus]|uniref:NUDIX domain-containing protein n=1 Tax=Falsibacillus pallidus TaxID=493781 RepID=A0A370G5M2_9BACI|nr:NUDIX hydrolase [Falsibacillus pallidus]RDI39118.1 NUDIX domain-containing protein [Falsibacillus pallidus]
MRVSKIRPIVICPFKKDDSIVVIEGFDEVTGEYFYRPIGGGIEYGERSSAALEREVLEEIGAQITNVKYLGTIENIFEFNGNLGHEVVFVYDAEFVDKSFYENTSFIGEEDTGHTFKLIWKPISDFTNPKFKLVPDELFDLIK